MYVCMIMYECMHECNYYMHVCMYACMYVYLVVDLLLSNQNVVEGHAYLAFLSIL